LGSNRFRECVFYRNWPNASIVASATYTEISNCLFVGNALLNFMGPGRVSNCTFGDNIGNASTDLALLVQSRSSVTVENTVFWNNGASESPDIEVAGGSTLNLFNTIVQGVQGSWNGSGNSAVDPMFRDAIGPDGIAATGDEDYRLTPDSPAINAGLINQYTPTNDLDGHSRVLCGAVDLGPYEFGIGDFDCDRQITAADFRGLVICTAGPATVRPFDCETLDFNGDNRVDLPDFALFQRSLDMP